MPNRSLVVTALLAILLLAAQRPFAADVPRPTHEQEVREIFVPFEDLNVLLEGQPRRVLLSRSEYAALLKQAEKAPETQPPLAVALLSADYDAAIRRQRAHLTGRLVLDVLQDGLHAVPLDLGGVGLQDAKLDGRPAPIGRAADGRPTLFVEGIGQHELVLQLVAPLQTKAARQVLQFRLPRPPAVQLRLSVPGDVEITSGAEVAGRVVDQAAGLTRFEILPRSGDTTLVMTLNSRLKRLRHSVVARSVLVDEVTEAYEKLHATISLAVLHQAVDRFRFALPEGFEITRVGSPLLDRWDVAEENGRRVLGVQLQEKTKETVVLSLSAIKTQSASESQPFPRSWRFPSLQPLDVVGQVAVVGLLVEQRLQANSVVFDSQKLTPIDTAVLSRALPESIFRAEPGTPPLRPVVAYYAPQGAFDLTARFDKPPAKLAVTTNLLLILSDSGQEVRGGFAVLPAQENRFSLDFSFPADWHILSVTAADEKPLSYQRYDSPGKPAVIHVPLPQGIPAGEEYRVYFHATCTPPGWLGDWKTSQRQVKFPVFAVVSATSDQGAIAVEARDDMTAHPLSVPLTPLDDAEKQKYGLAGVATNLAYRYETPDYEATLLIRRTQPRLIARTFSFLRVQPGALSARYELIYNVQQARTRTLELQLPAETTPETLSIRGLGGAELKQYDSRVAEVDGRKVRRWRVQLEEARRGAIHLAVDFQQPLPQQEFKDFSLPIVSAAGPRLAYQSGLVAVEGSAELDVQVKTVARRLDVGELVDAEYQPGRRLLGVYGFVDDPSGDAVAVAIDVARDAGYPMPAAIVQRAELSTHLAAAGISQTQGHFRLRTKALYLEVQLPPKSELWSASLDGVPLKPQRDGDSLLVSLPSQRSEVQDTAPDGQTTDALRDLRIVYEMPIDISPGGKLAVAAPKLLLRAGADAPAVEVSLADLVWHLHLPSGYEVVAAGGTLVPDRDQLTKPLPAAVYVAGALYWLSGGVEPFWGVHLAAREAARRAVQSGYDRRAAPEAYYMDDDAGYATGEAADAPAFEGSESTTGAPPESEDMEMDSGAAGPGEEPTPDEMPAPAAEPPPPPPQAPATPQLKLPPRIQRLEGVRSLQIDLDQADAHAGQTITFRSLGGEPRLEVTMANRLRHCMLGWGLALAVGLIGLAITNRTPGSKARFVLIVALLATLVPLAYDSTEAIRVCNLIFFAASLLVPYYLVAGLVKWIAALFRRRPVASAAATAAAAATLLIAVTVPTAEAAGPPSKPTPYVIQVVEPLPPVDVPEDAVILPYDPESDAGIEGADKLLLPYDKYVELWNRAQPDKKIETPKPPAPYALAGASYAAKLQGEEFLLVTGQLELDVYAEGYVAIPLGLAGGVLARAELDGKPARLSVARPGPARGLSARGLSQFSRSENGTVPLPPQKAQPSRGLSQFSPSENGTVPLPQQQTQTTQPAPNQPRATQVPPGGSLVVLYASGKGRHRLDLAVRMRLTRQGGWRVARGVLPSAPATALELVVPDPETELKLDRVADRLAYETQQADEKIETALGADGTVGIQWRPKVAEGQVDLSLTARSTAVLDVQEDGLRLVWRLQLEFRRSERAEFRINVPAAYLLEKVEGTNVRGWQRDQQQPNNVDVTLLKPARGQETFTLHLWRKGPVGQGELAQFDVPVVGVADAALHDGQLTIRRSPLLNLRTLTREGVTRIDLGPWAAELAGGADNEESPLGIRPYQAYRLVTSPFSIRLAADPLQPKRTATVQTVLKIAEYERILESRVALQAEGRPVYLVEMLVPADLEITHVSAPGQYEWALVEQGDRRRLSVYLATGQQGEVPILLSGTLGRRGAIQELPLPGIEALHVASQQGDIAVQLDPALNVTTDKLQNCKSVLLKRIYGWLNPPQQRATRLALHYDRPDYQGTLTLSPRPASVTCETISNVRVTDRAVEETILLEFTIRNAGIHELAFLLPSGMDDCRIQVPMLRQKKIEKTRQGALRVWLQLQDEVMGQLRVLVENDRALGERSYRVPVPAVETWRTSAQFVALENAGRDEVVVDDEQLAGMEVLSRQQKQWDRLKGVLGAKHITRAYLVVPGTEEPRLVFHTKTRKAVETAGARIGLAETVLVLDTNGTYRAAVTYRLDNTTEQFLEIELPTDARLWTARVADEPVKPATLPGSPLVRIPLVKTAPGDLDYTVVLIYGGKMPALGGLSTARFPLVHTKNINVELSQVRLFVPKTHRWFGFGGTMGLATVAEEDDLAAGFVSYNTKKLEQLRQTMRGSDKFAKVRAAHNLKQIGMAIQEFQATRGSYANPKLQEELQSNAGVLRQAQRELEQLDVAPQGDDTDNRFRLNARYGEQKSNRSRNVVQDLGRNWYDFDQKAPAEKAGEEMVLFNGRWLYGNQLDNNIAVEGSGQAAAPAGGEPSLNARSPGTPGGDFIQFKGKKHGGAKPVQPTAPEVAQGRAKARLAEGYSKKMTEFDQSNQPADGDANQAVLRYQQELQQQAGERWSGRGNGLALGNEARRPPGEDRAQPQSGQPGYPVADLVMPIAPDVPGQPVTWGAAPPTGLASLELELPQHDDDFYRVYRFTTPRGEVEITAWAASDNLAMRLLQLAVVLAVLALLAYALRLVRTGRLAWLGGRGGSTALICVGLVAILAGVLPGAGLVALLAGIAVKIRRVAARSTPSGRPITAEVVQP